MKTTRIFLSLVMLCGTAFATPAPTITTTPTNGPTTINIHARTTDGKLPLDVICTVVEPMGQNSVLPMPQPLPLVGSSGDWTVTNVPPGAYEVYVRGTNFAEDRNSIIQFLFVKTNTHYSIDFVLSRGATIKGRVLDDATGKPISNAFLFCGTEGSSQNSHTDEEGRYELAHIAGAFIIDARTTNHVMQRIYVGGAAEASIVSIPDIRLQHGRWISGRVERPVGVESNVSAMVTLEIQGGLPTNSLIEDAFTRKDDTFHTSPLPAGTYTLSAKWHRPFKSSPQTWEAKGSVSGIKVVVGRDTTNVVIPTKMIVPANDQSGR